MPGDTPNAAQAAYWNETVGPTWAELQGALDRQLGALTVRAVAALRPHAGERILDVGCGAGASTMVLADAVGKSGEVVGVDISRPLLEVAQRRGDNVTGIRFVEGDAQTYPFEPGSFDGAFSRFGVMFFADPTAAFANIRGALRPRGRLTFVCWRGMAENPVLVLPLMAALAHLPPPPPADPNAPGPFAFADPDKVRGILVGAGFTEIALKPNDMKMGTDMETALMLAQRIGPLGGMLREHPDKREVAVAAVREALARHDGPDGVMLDSATWIVTARAPA
jgi:SAM-dependent methyltransferase